MAFLSICLFTGGSSRPDAGLLVILRMTAAISLAALLLVSPRIDLGSMRFPAILLGMFGATMAIQLIPLPPAIWLALPGHAPYADIAAIAGVDQPWRPLSLTPDLTLNSLLALVPIIIVIIGFSMAEKFRGELILFPLALAFVSVVLGLVQITGGSGSGAYLYRPTSDTLPVGLFANRNHQAAVLATALPALAVWAQHPDAGRYRLVLAAGFGLLLLPVILVTGSRAGLLLAGLGMAFALALAWPTLKRRRIRRFVLAGGVGLMMAVIVATILAGRAISIDRLAEANEVSSQLRLSTLPIVSKITWDFFPFGTGYGAFDQVFRQYEPDTLLKPTYFNRAHNDVLETVMSGGLAAMLIMMAFAFWWIRQTVQAWRSAKWNSYRGHLARLGAAITLMLVLASLVDYPLRTPLAGMLFALGCCWLSLSNGSNTTDMTDRAPDR